MPNPEYNVELSADKKSVEVTVGAEKLVLSIDEAYGFAEIIQNVAGQPGFEDHVDRALGGWGEPGWTDGGTC